MFPITYHSLLCGMIQWGSLLIFEVNELKNKIIALILSMTLIFNITACNNNKLTRYEAEFLNVFDTVTQVKGYAKNKEEFSEFTQLIHDSLKEYHELYDIYNNYEGINNLKTINDNAGKKPIKVDKRIIDLLKASKEAYDLTDGKINVAYGAVLSIWHDYREEGINDPEKAKLPPLEELQSMAKHTDIHKMIIDEENSSVYLEDPQMSLDVGAIAKGYATEQVAQIVMEHGYKDGMISVGGNVRTFGGKGKDKGPWNVGVQNPDMESENKNLHILELKDKSLVTSGDYQRYYIVDGKPYHHIIEPDTLMPSVYFRAVTIVCEDSGLADVLSTAIFNMPFEKGLEFIEDIPEVEALWIFKDGSIQYSSHFKDYIAQ